ncbi:MAG: hypothetical protein U9Q98_12175 [Bacteroidota bacterium]|nr:hypothetical protein [Bacteroidota bacterium]
MLYLKSEGGLRSEGLKCMTDAESANMSTVTVAVATVKGAMLSIAAGGVQFSPAVVKHLRI